jgi:outer membrane protein TolC
MLKQFHLFKKKSYFLFLLLLANVGFSQVNKEISLEQLQQLVVNYYPTLKQQLMYGKLAESKKQLLNTNYLPQISLVGTATYQSEVTKFNFSIPGATTFNQKQDQYSVGLELKENIFDYGAIKTQKKIEQLIAESQNKQIDADFIKVKERIEQLYSTIQLCVENLSILALKQVELTTKQKRVSSLVQNGAGLKSSLLVIEAEILMTEQKIAEVNSMKQTCIEVLSLLTNQKFDATTRFKDIETNATLKVTLNRPESQLFELQKNTNSLREKMITKSNLPKVYVFGRGYFGRPGYNFLNNDFRTYGMVGVGLNWNLSSYYTLGKEKKNLQIASELITVQKEAFELNVQTLLVQQKEEILKLEKLIEMDVKIQAIKKEILAVSSSQLDNGIITSAEFIIDLNADQQARTTTSMHQIQLAMVKRAYNTTLGY